MVVFAINRFSNFHYIVFLAVILAKTSMQGSPISPPCNFCNNIYSGGQIYAISDGKAFQIRSVLLLLLYLSIFGR